MPRALTTTEYALYKDFVRPFRQGPNGAVGFDAELAGDGNGQVRKGHRARAARGRCWLGVDVGGPEHRSTSRTVLNWALRHSLTPQGHARLHPRVVGFPGNPER